MPYGFSESVMEAAERQFSQEGRPEEDADEESPVKASNSPKAEDKPPEAQSPEKEPDPAAEDKPNPLHARILDLDRQKMTPHTISDVLEEELGAVVSEAEIMDVIVRHAKGEI